jgi:UDP-N-acetylglucosamine 2-epimerase
MPEEINRVLTDHCSDILFTPSKLASQNLKNESIQQNSISNVGDIMCDVFLSIYKNLKKTNKTYDILVAIHRAENTNCKSKMLNIIKNLNKLSKEYNIIFPTNPRTKKAMCQHKILKLLSKKIKAIRPLSYKQAIYHLKYAKLLITDSGGIQKEAFFAKTQALTIREETERPEIICAKWNRLVKPKKSSIYNIAKKYISSKGNSSKRYGNGKTEKLILKKS